jgi:hypothetical protein
MRKLPHTAAEDLLEAIMRRYERASTILTSALFPLALPGLGEFTKATLEANQLGAKADHFAGPDWQQAVDQRCSSVVEATAVDDCLQKSGFLPGLGQESEGRRFRQSLIP